MKTPHRITRRTFARQTGLLAGGALLGTKAVPVLAAEPKGKSIPRRILGRTGVSVTTLTLGTAPVGMTRPNSPRKVAECVQTALELGINAIDTAPAYEAAEEGVGLALGQRRKEVFLSTKVMADAIAEAEKILANSLRLLKTDYLDLVYFHNVGERNTAMALESKGVLAWLERQKQAGKLRFVGISGHNRTDKFAQLLESGVVDVLLTVVNLADRHTYNFEERVLPLARKHNVGIVAMKVFGGARNMQYADALCPPQLDAAHLDLAVRYALNVPGVATVNLGAHNPNQIRENFARVRDYQPLKAEETAEIARLGKDLAAKWGAHFGPVTG